MTHHQKRKARAELNAYRQELNKQKTFAGKVRKIILDNGPIQRCEIAEYLDLTTGRERSKLSGALCDMVKSNRIRRVKTGVYAAPVKEKSTPKKQEVMWRVLRARKVVTANDLVELAGVTKGYAQEWLRTLVKWEAVRRLENGKHRLIADTVQPPLLTDNAIKLREIRRKAKEAHVALDMASQSLERVRKTMRMVCEA